MIIKGNKITFTHELASPMCSTWHNAVSTCFAREARLNKANLMRVVNSCVERNRVIGDKRSTLAHLRRAFFGQACCRVLGWLDAEFNDRRMATDQYSDFSAQFSNQVHWSSTSIDEQYKVFRSLVKQYLKRVRDNKVANKTKETKKCQTKKQHG